MLHYLAVGSLICYFVAAVLFMLSVLGMRVGFARYARYFAALAFLSQTCLLLPILNEYEKLLPESRGQYLFWLSWSIAALYFALGKKARYPIIGAFTAPAAAFFFAASSYLSHKTYYLSESSGGNFIIFFHIVPALLAELALVVAFIVGFVYLILERRIKNKSAASFVDPVPSLRALDKANRKVLYAGFFFMTVAILSGTFTGLKQGAAVLSGDLYQVLALLVWLALAFILHVRVNMRWSAKRCAMITVVLAALIIISMLLLMFFQGNMIHDYAV